MPAFILFFVILVSSFFIGCAEAEAPTKYGYKTLTTAEVSDAHRRLRILIEQQEYDSASELIRQLDADVLK